MLWTGRWNLQKKIPFPETCSPGKYINCLGGTCEKMPFKNLSSFLFFFFHVATWKNIFCRSAGNQRSEFHRCRFTGRKRETARGFHAIPLALCGVTSTCVSCGAAMHCVLWCTMVVQPALPLLLACVRRHLQHRDVRHPQLQISQSLELEAEEFGDKVGSK